MQLIWPNCLNVRDLGGLPVAGGRTITPGALIRSDNHDRLTEVGVAAVRTAAVSRIVDVRAEWECEAFPSPFRGEAIYRNVPLSDLADPYDPGLSLEQQYVVMLERNPGRFAAAVGAIADAPAGAVVVHCHAGKDRSGIVVALTLSLAGVPAEAVAADWAVLNDRVRESFAEQLTLVDDPAKRHQLAESFAARPETMVAVLAYLDEAYGGVEQYLRRGGLGDNRIHRLRERLVS